MKEIAASILVIGGGCLLVGQAQQKDLYRRVAARDAGIVLCLAGVFVERPQSIGERDTINGSRQTERDAAGEQHLSGIGSSALDFCQLYWRQGRRQPSGTNLAEKVRSDWIGRKSEKTFRHEHL